MYAYLANLLDTYSKNNRLLDKYALERILEIYQRETKELISFTKDIIIKPKNKERTFATYDIIDKIIKIYLEKIYKYLKNIYKSFEYRKKNEFIMSIMLHEIEHAKQNLLANLLCNDLECNIVRASIVIQSNEAYYLKNSSLCPLERLADIDSLIEMMLITNNTPEYFRQINKIMHSGYPKKFNGSPTEKYIEQAYLESYFKFSKSELERIKEMYSFEQRLRLGLRVTKEEFNQKLEPNLTLEKLRK